MPSTSITAELYIHDSVDYDELFELDENSGEASHPGARASKGSVEV